MQHGACWISCLESDVSALLLLLDWDSMSCLSGSASLAVSDRTADIATASVRTVRGRGAGGVSGLARNSYWAVQYRTEA